MMFTVKARQGKKYEDCHLICAAGHLTITRVSFPARLSQHQSNHTTLLSNAGFLPWLAVLLTWTIWVGSLGPYRDRLLGVVLDRRNLVWPDAGVCVPLPG